MVDQREIVLDYSVAGLLDLFAPGLDPTRAFDDLVLHELQSVLVLCLVGRLLGRRGCRVAQTPHLGRDLVWVAERAQGLFDLLNHLVVILHILQFHLLLLDQEKIDSPFQVFQKCLERTGLQLEGLLDVGSVNPDAHAFYTRTLVSRRLDQTVGPLVELQGCVDVLVREDHLCMESLVHQQGLAQRAGAFAEDIVGSVWDDRAQCEDEIVDVFHVQVIRRDRVRDRVCRQLLRSLLRKGCHVLGVELDRVILELISGHRFQATSATRQIGVPLNPTEAIQVDDPLAHVNIALFDFFDAILLFPIQVVNLCTLCHEGEIEEVPVEGHHDMRVDLLYQIEKPSQQGSLVRLVERVENSFVLGLRGILQGLDVLRYLGPVHQKEAGAVGHNRNHGDPIVR
mmetsp:Transcript_5173/g.15419  ORF Transcript_5173/g.15419 Transcript_5173/m.15419 type:complete len:397 (-) Transcript_5173:1153-2343(-)